MNTIKSTVIVFVAAVATLLLTSYASAQKSTIPVERKAAFEDTYTIIWNGYSKAYTYTDGTWLRAEPFDYYFDVVQKRYDNEWKSVKSLHRLHPDYNGKAGDRDQTMYFGVTYESLVANKVIGNMYSSLGNGRLTTDHEFRNSIIEIDVKNAGLFTPYNKIRITQKYDYEHGKLTETVLLVKAKGSEETPFMKNEEEAYFYTKGKLDKAPTTFNQPAR
ncbi:hypothetical protein FAES_3852 [Fibrella aestuarina BUZ 2]|uniref:Uncharacterized protein n=1 Tax=Fibrella aestuarina BUZ 2 TaxID=1166018 RepID=I0KCK5_9BACT|nr:hypothetical protein [Fibrella aestuarina]CCH01858.1 hypothetical protein FAES_3852 [Fibrella aestuarina BUZ 2]